MGFQYGRFRLSKWTILLAVVGVVCVIMIVASRKPEVVAWVKVNAPDWLIPDDAPPEDAKCHSMLEDEKFSGTAKDLREQAEEGNVDAQVKLGADYFWNRAASQGSSDQDFFEAQKWLGKAAEQGSAKAQLLLAKLYATGTRRISPDWEEAWFWTVLSMKRETKIKGLPRCETLSLLKEVETHLNYRQKAALEKRMSEWKPVVTPPKPKTKPAPGVKPADAAALPAKQTVPDKDDPCGAYIASAHDYRLCQDREQKVQRMLEGQKTRNKAYQPASTETGEEKAPEDGEKQAQ